MASPQRVERVREAIKKEMGDIIQHLRDPRIGFVTVTDTEVSRDLEHVKVFVSVYGTQEEKERTMEGLRRATGHVRTEIGRRIRLHHTPEIVFVFDESIEYGFRINSILQELKESEAVKAGGDDEDESQGDNRLDTDR